MKLLAELTAGGLGLDGDNRQEGEYKLRRAARAVLFNDKGEIAFQRIERDDYAKLPGGGMDPGETIEEGLRRELREEVGCEITVGEPVGMVMEYRNEFGVLQISYAFIAHVDGEVGEPKLEQEEIDEQLVPIWVKPEEALKLLDESSLDIYKVNFIVERDRLILKEALRIKDMA